MPRSASLSSELRPLVEPGPSLTDDQALRYSRNLSLGEVGSVGQRRFANARVLSIGAGGLGSPALLYLAAAGVGIAGRGRLGVIDHDVVEQTNLQRQIIHTEASVGELKTQSAAARVRALNPQVRVTQHTEQLTAANAAQIFAEYDLVIDGSDNFPTRYLVADAATMTHTPYIWGSILGFRGQISTFWDAAPGGRARSYRDLYPAPPPVGSVPSCVEAGVLGVTCGVIGSLMGLEALKLIAGIGEPLLGKLLLFDGLQMLWQTVTFNADPNRLPVGSLAASVSDIDSAGPGAGSDIGSAAVAGISPRKLAELLKESTDLLVLDVRQDYERQIVDITGSLHIAHTDVLDGSVQVPRDKPIVVFCKAGPRSELVADYLRGHGYSAVDVLAGGVLAWVEQIDHSGTMY